MQLSVIHSFQCCQRSTLLVVSKPSDEASVFLNALHGAHQPSCLLAWPPAAGRTGRPLHSNNQHGMAWHKGVAPLRTPQFTRQQRQRVNRAASRVPVAGAAAAAAAALTRQPSGAGGGIRRGSLDLRRTGQTGHDSRLTTRSHRCHKPYYACCCRRASCLAASVPPGLGEVRRGCGPCTWAAPARQARCAVSTALHGSLAAAPDLHATACALRAPVHFNIATITIDWQTKLLELVIQRKVQAD